MRRSDADAGSGSISTVPDPVDRETRLDGLRSKLADFGVALFDRPRATTTAPVGDEYAALIVDLLESGDARLRLAVPCLLAAHDGAPAAAATTRAAAMLSAAAARELGLLYRLARCLVVSRGPYLAFLFGRRPTLPPLPIEPSDVPDPSELHGEKGLRFASEVFRERGLPDMPGGAERQFDTWLDLVRTHRWHRESA
jgi:hypothetical protein